MLFYLLIIVMKKTKCDLNLILSLKKKKKNPVCWILFNLKLSNTTDLFETLFESCNIVLH